MLGFDALGRLALGQLSIGASTAILSASPGSFALTGGAVALNTTIAASVAPYTLAGKDAAFVGKLAAAVGAYSESGAAALFVTGLAAGTSPIRLPAAARPRRFARSLAPAATPSSAPAQLCRRASPLTWRAMRSRGRRFRTTRPSYAAPVRLPSPATPFLVTTSISAASVAPSSRIVQQGVYSISPRRRASPPLCLHGL
jgi:hypothetical protein